MQRLVLVALVALAASACASGSGVPRPGVPGSASSRARGGEAEATARGHRIVAAALNLRGVQYRNGGTDPAGFDCSGLVAYVFGQQGLTMPRQTSAQFAVGARIRKDQIQAGDLIFFSTVAPGASHVGIAVDDDEFVHAPSSGGVVRVERLALPYWQRRFIGARRVR
ncbi:MAG: C40 family peptidase [Acidobacteria bacterium]|nr:C40 family peptidase [Acidobacteriota bacterium]